MLPIDNIDLNILTILQRNGRATNSSLAAEINLSTAATLERVKKLENRKIIIGYTVLLSPKKLNLNFELIVKLKLKNTNNVNTDIISNTISKIPHIVSCSQMMCDDADFIFRVLVDSIQTYRDKVAYKLNATGLVDNLKESLVLSTIKQVLNVADILNNTSK